MSSRLVQLQSATGERTVAVTSAGKSHRIKHVTSVYELALEAIKARISIEQLVNQLGTAESVNLSELLARKQILTPIDHPDTAHLWLTGTGLTHLGSADARDRMHAKAHAAQASDSMKMFRMGLDGGKHPGMGHGVQPEWFYKGDGSSLVPPEAPLTSPQFALNGGEEPEIAGIYVI